MDVGMINNMAGMALNMSAEDVQLELSVAVMKQIKEMQDMQMEMISKLMESMPSPDPAVGQNIDFSV